MGDTARKVRAARDIAVNGLVLVVVIGGLLALLGFAVWSAIQGEYALAIVVAVLFAVIALWKLASKKTS